MEQILTKTGNKVDAVVASNDGTAGGVVAALRAQNMVGIPVSGQDGDIAALNRVALGEQTVSVFKDARKLGEAAGTVAVQLGKGKKRKDIAGTTVRRRHQEDRADLDAAQAGAGHVGQPRLRDLGGWATKAQVCRGVSAAKAPKACK